MKSAWNQPGNRTAAQILQSAPSAASAIPAVVPPSQPIALTEMQLAGYKAQAVRQTMDMLDIQEKAGTHVLCCMFYLDKNSRLQAVMETSGEPSRKESEAVLALRANAATDISKFTKNDPKDKQTWCAEEFLLAKHPEKRFLFSWAFDGRLRNDIRKDVNISPQQINKGQMVKACRASCRGILESKKIVDLVSTEHWGMPRAEG